MTTRRPPGSLALFPTMAGLALGVLVSACGPITYDGPTSLVLKVLLNEGHGTRTLYISGTDSTPVDVFPRTRRPQTAGAELTTNQTVRVLLDDTLAGTAITLTVVGFDEADVPIESGTADVTPVARAETPVTVKLALYGIEPDAGVDAGTEADAGSDAGVACGCTTTCCLPGQATCADAGVSLDSRVHLVLAGGPKQVCKGLCDYLKADSWTLANGCGCGTGPTCGEGLRCQSGQCLCDTLSGCPGCCVAGSNGTSSACRKIGAETALACGNGSFTCENCSGTKTCNLGVCLSCSASGCETCTPEVGKCCSGNGQRDVKFPTCLTYDHQCSACDVARSNQCVTATGTSITGCSCGKTGAPCGPNQLCTADGRCTGFFSK